MKIQLFSLIILSVFSCSKSEKETIANEPISEIVPTTQVKISAETVVDNKGIIWGFDFLPDGAIIYTEKSGKMSVFKNNQSTEITGLPKDINAEGQGGLLDVCLHPNYKNNAWIYATYSSVLSSGGQLNLIRFKIENNQIKELSTIFKTSASNKWKGHYGSRIVFDKNNFLFLAIGEGGTTSYGGPNSANMNAQLQTENWGKIHRINDDGTIPADNPKFGNANPSSIYSKGHRNPQGLVYLSEKDQLWETEHGPRGGDELNFIEKGANYGWPLVSTGINYDGKSISENHKKEGITEPRYSWVPSIGTSGIAYLSSSKYGNWKGSFLVGGLALRYLAKVSFDTNNKAVESKVLENYRIRHVKQGPDGLIYIAVENPGRILKLNPSF